MHLSFDVECLSHLFYLSSDILTPMQELVPERVCVCGYICIG